MISNQRQAYISQHLNVLRQAGLVTSRKEGQWIFYRASDPELFDVIDQVKVILQNLDIWKPGSPEDGIGAEKKKVCNCPQCSSLNETRVCVPQDSLCP